MCDEKDEQPESPIIKVASSGATASGVIALCAFLWVHTTSDLGLFAVALMVAAPSVMAVFICYFITKQKPG